MIGEDPAGHGPLVSVVVPVRNAVATIGEQLHALAAQEDSGRWELVVVDNGSTDGTGSLVESLASSLSLPLRLIAETAEGVNAARNAGVRASRGQKILLADGDDRVGRRWIGAMRRGLDSADCVGGVLLPFGAIDQEPIAALRETAFLPYPSGANCGFRREVFDTVGGFDSTFALGGDEVDFFWRAQLAGFSLLGVPEADVAYRQRRRRVDRFRQMHDRARAQPLLHRRFGAVGMSPSSTWGAARSWARLVLRTPGAVLSERSREAWMLDLARRSGRLLGSVRHRHLYL